LARVDDDIGDIGDAGDIGDVGDVVRGDDLTADLDMFSSHYPTYLSPEWDVPIQVSSTQLQFEQSPIATVDPYLLQLSPSFDHSIDSFENDPLLRNFSATFDPLPLIPNIESHSKSDAEGIDIDITDLLATHTNIEPSSLSSDSPSSVTRSASETIRCDFPGCDLVFKDRRRLKYGLLYLLTLQ
jgi:hypothetical protein